VNTEKQQEQLTCAPKKVSTKEKCNKAFTKLGLSIINMNDKIRAKFGYGGVVIAAITASAITLGVWWANDFDGAYLDAFIECMDHLLNTVADNSCE
jgi:hypothetical protein